ncbi:MAG: helix-turn-helix domain-containing protein [Clostridia bacterium]|nr:helix-turn-helix domain-containing protein [Clostridia bacterium]
MNNSILLSDSQTAVTYEPHIKRDSSLPFIFHLDRIRKNALANLHENIELLCFLSGEGEVLLGKERVAVRGGVTVAVNSLVSHRVLTDTELEFACLIVDSRFLSECGIDVRSVHFNERIESDSVQELFSEVITEFTEGLDYSEAGIRSSVLRLVLTLCREHSRAREAVDSPDSGAVEYVCQASEYIRNNLSERLTLDGIARSVGLSKYHFIREFKRVTGMTVIDYVSSLRCSRARELLTEGASVKEAALRSGFSNLSYFSKVFRRYVGSLPSELSGKRSANCP